MIPGMQYLIPAFYDHYRFYSLSCQGCGQTSQCPSFAGLGEPLREKLSTFWMVLMQNVARVTIFSFLCNLNQNKQDLLFQFFLEICLGPVSPLTSWLHAFLDTNLYHWLLMKHNTGRLYRQFGWSVIVNYFISVHVNIVLNIPTCMIIAQ